MSDIFISYKREDQEIARKIASALEEEGWTVWWDPKLRAGEHFDDAIEEALTAAKCVIVLWSEGSLKSQYVRDEATYALEHNKLVPVAIEAVEMPFRFRGVHTLRLLAWDGSRDSSAFRKFVNDISAILGDSSKIIPDHANHEGEQNNAPRTRRDRSPKRKIEDKSRKPMACAHQKKERILSKVERATNARERQDMSPLVRPKLDRILGWCGLATLVLGYIATLLGRISEFYLFELVGPNRLLSIHFGMKFAVAALFIVGYFTLAVWVYRRYLRQLENLKRRLWGAGAVTACGLLLAGGSIFAAIPPKPNILVFLDKEASLWDRVLLELNVKGGGLKTSKFDPSAEPQVWSTAQALTGILVNGPTGLRETDGEQIRRTLRVY